jgi:hypothetical protein
MADIFGAFLNTVQVGADLNVAHDSLTEFIKSYSKAKPVIPAIVESVAQSKDPSTVISVADATGLTIDRAADGLRTAVETGLLKAVTAPDGGVAYQLTGLGQKLGEG